MVKVVKKWFPKNKKNLQNSMGFVLWTANTIWVYEFKDVT